MKPAVNSCGDYAMFDDVPTGWTQVPERPSWLFEWDGVKWVNSKKAERQDAIMQLVQTDTQICRITEDMFDVLMSKGIISINDFPAADRARISQKIADRKALRDKLK